MTVLPYKERLHFAHVLYELKSPIHKEELKALVESGKEVFPRAVALMTSNLKFRSVTAADIDALPWDEETMTVKRCQWCAAFEKGSSASKEEMKRCTANGKTQWYCNGTCQRKQQEWNLELQKKKNAENTVTDFQHTSRRLV